MKAIIFAFTVLVSNAFTLDHPLKMSFSKLDITKKGVVEIETRIFLDDLTEHIEKIYGMQGVEFSAITSDGTQALQRYLSNRFYFEQGGKKFPLWIKGVSFSKNKLALVVNLSTNKRLKVSKEITIVNTLLCDATPTQVNDIKFMGNHYRLGVVKPKIKLSPTDK